MNLKLNITLPEDWSQIDCPDGPATFGRDDGVGAFQVSWGEYTGGKIPNPSAADLLEMTENFGQGRGFGEMTEAASGACRFGKFGTGVFQTADMPRLQVWYISNGRDFIMATHFCEAEPDTREIAATQEIAASLILEPKS